MHLGSDSDTDPECADIELRSGSFSSRGVLQMNPAAVQTSGRPGGEPEHDYWELTRQPLPSLVFIVPLLFLYEAGVALLGQSSPAEIRNGADHWLRQAILSLGLNAGFVLPSLIVLALSAWHYTGNYRRQFTLETYAGMTAESLLFSVLLIVMGQAQDLLFQKMSLSELALNVPTELPLAVGYLGAGLYEEFLFRLLLLSGLFLALTSCRIPRPWSMGAAVVISSILFAAAHYVGPAADGYDHFGFLFRFVAGLYFAALFVFRGFGIAVGTHAAYDLIVGLSLAPVL